MTSFQGRRPWGSDTHGPLGQGRWGRLLVAVAAVGTVAWLGTAPVAADDRDANVPDGCVLHAEDFEYNNGVNFYVGHHPYIQCEAEQSDLSCVDVDMQSSHTSQGEQYDMTPAEFRDGDFFCALHSGAEFRECQNDVRFNIRGPLEPDEEQRFWSLDHHGHVLVADSDPAWWVNEFDAEQALATDGDFEGGQSCEVGSSRPTYLTCEEIEERRAELDAELADAFADRDVLSADDDIAGDIEADLSVSERTSLAELRQLETSGGIVPDGCWGEYPSARYEVTWDVDEEGVKEANASRLMGWTAKVFFEVAKTCMGLALWLVELGFSFDVNSYREAVGDFAERVDVNFVHLGGGQDISLFTMAWFALFVYVGFHVLRGRVGLAAGELLVAVLAAAVGVVLVGNFFPASEGGEYRAAVSADGPTYSAGSYFDVVGNLLNASGLAMLRVANDDDPDMSPGDMGGAEVREVISETNGRLFYEFVERPYLFLNYGKDDFSDDVADTSGLNEELIGVDADYEHLSCEEVAHHLKAVDSSGSWTLRFMDRNGCQDMAEHNGAMTVERLMNATVVVAVAVIVAAALGLVAATLLVAKFMVALVFVALPIAVVLALLPGRTRSLAFGWGTTLLQLWLVALGMGLILALVLMGVNTIHSATETRPLAERWLMVLLLVVALYLLRKRLVAAAQTFARGVQDQLTEMTGDRSAGGPRFNDMDLDTVDRGAAAAGRVGKNAALVGGGLALAGGALAYRGATALPRAGKRYMVRQHGRRRGAKMDNAPHYRNTMESQAYGEAQNVATGGAPSREKVLEDNFSKGAAQRQQAREVDARAAAMDFETLALGTSRKQRAAVERLGLDWNTWRSSKGRRRQALRNQARQNRDYMIERAGGWGNVEGVVLGREAGQQVAAADRRPVQEQYRDRASLRERQDRADPTIPASSDNAGSTRDMVATRSNDLRKARVASEGEAWMLLRQYRGGAFPNRNPREPV